MTQDQARRMAEEVLTKTEIRKVYAFVPYRDHETSVNYIDFAHAIVAAALVKLTQGQETFKCPSCQHEQSCGEIRCNNCSHEYEVASYPAPSQQEERVRELESVLDVVLNQLKKWQANGGVKSGYEFIDVAITVIDAARSKEQGK